jgi:hypothetical protein
MKRNMLCGLAILSMAILMSACAGPGMRKDIPITMPRGEKATIVAHNQIAPDWLLDKDRLALNYIVKGAISTEQLAAVAETERACRIYTGVSRPNKLVAVLSSGILYGTSGFIGIGLGSQAFKGVNSLAYAAYGGTAGFAGGLANGIVNLGSQVYSFENCGREILSIFPDYKIRVLP